MSNILAIANKELRSYFASPIAYAVVGFFALAFGFMFYSFLHSFGMQSLRMGQMGMGGPVNINQMMIRPLVMQISVIVLFMLPMVTMRTYSEEKRSGTIELLLTSPVTDWQIILGKFLGALGLYAMMLLVTLPSVALALLVRQPRLEARRHLATWGCCCWARASSRSACSSRARRRTRSSPACSRSCCC